MNDKKQVSITIGLMCVVLTCAIVVQLNTIKEATKIVGTSYAEQSLKDEVLRWKENYESLYKNLEETEEKLEKARSEATQENGRGTELEGKLSNINKLLGLTELTGRGVVVTLSDNTTVTSEGISVDEDINDYVVHDEDLRSVVNELYNAGAEAISINGQRLVNTSAITCSGTVITINGIKLNSPFVISAIGNPESLYSIERTGGYIELMRQTGAIAETTKSNNITVPKFSGALSSKYMRNVE